MTEMQKHYAEFAEAGRLEAGAGRLERARTEEIVERWIAPPPARVADVGGGPGVYATWLAGRGYDVELIDAVPLHVEQALQHARDQARVRARMGDARDLDLEDESCDAVLLLGPLYHLTERMDRIRALREAVRVLRPGGVVFAAGISRFASLLDGFARQLVRDPDFVSILDRDLHDGQHRNPTTRTVCFTTAFFHRPAQLAEEITAAGLTPEALLAVEGPFWCLGSFDQLWDDPATRSLMLRYLGELEADPVMLGVSAHLLAIGRKP